MRAGLISSPTGYDPAPTRTLPSARRNQVLENMADQGYITEEKYQEYIVVQYDIPKPSQIHPRRRALPPHTSRRGCASSSSTSTAPAKPWRRPRHHLDVDLALEKRCQQIGASTWRARSSTAIVGAGQRNRGSARDGGRLRLERRSRSTWPPRAIVSPARRSSCSRWSCPRAGPLFNAGGPVQPPGAPVQGGGPERERQEEGRGRPSEVNNYGEQLPRQRLDLTAITYSENSVNSQLGMQVPANIAETARRMGVETDLSTGTTKYSVNGSDFQPYNPALILGGLQTGVTPLEMAHAFETLAEGGRRITGSMAAGKDGPVGIVKVSTRAANRYPPTTAPRAPTRRRPSRRA